MTQLPSRFGKYLLLERLHATPFAEVFLARTGLQGAQRLVALKRINPSEEEEASVLETFLEEVKISLRLNHSAIVYANDVDQHQGSYYLAMEYLSGMSLAELLGRCSERGLRLGIARAAYLASRVAEGLDHAHRLEDPAGVPLGIVHRAVSPENILVSWSGEVKLIDFGMAKAATRLRKTQVGVLKGKSGYMSPEQVRGGTALDRRSDLFSLGVVLFEMLTGTRAFTGASEMEILERLAQGTLPRPREVDPTLPPGLEALLLKACAPAPADRYQWGSELQQDLLRFALQEGGTATAKEFSQWLTGTFAAEHAAEKERLALAARVGVPDGPPLGRPQPPTGSRPAVAAARPRGSSGSHPVVSRPGGSGSQPKVVPPFSFEDEEVDLEAPEERTQIVRSPLFHPSPVPAPPPVFEDPLPWNEDATGPSIPSFLAPAESAVSPLPVDPPVQPLPAPRRRRGLLIASAAVALLAVAAAAVLALGDREPKKAQVLVQVTPSVKAQVTVGGRLVAADTVNEFPAGEYDIVVVSPGYRRHSQRVSIFQDEGNAVFSVFLEREEEPAPPEATAAAPQTFSVRFEAPDGAEVRLDGALLGVGSVLKSGLALGQSYAYQVSRPGFVTAEGQLSPSEPGEVRVPVTLAPAPVVSAVAASRPDRERRPGRSVGFLVYAGEPEGAALWVNGKPSGRVTPVLPDNPLALPVGRHRVHLQIAGLSSATRTVEIRKDAVVVLRNLALDTEDGL